MRFRDFHYSGSIKDRCVGLRNGHGGGRGVVSTRKRVSSYGVFNTVAVTRSWGVGGRDQLLEQSEMMGVGE